MMEKLVAGHNIIINEGSKVYCSLLLSKGKFKTKGFKEDTLVKEVKLATNVLGIKKNLIYLIIK